MDIVKWETSAIQLKAISGVLKDILTQIWIVFQQNKIEILNADPEKIVTIHMVIEPDMTRYHAKSRQTFSTYAQTMYKVLRGISKEETASLSMTSQDILLIELEESFNRISLKSLQDPAPDFICPCLLHDVRHEMDTKQLHNILRDLSSVSRHLTIELCSGAMNFIGSDSFGTTTSFSVPTTFSRQYLKQSFILKYIERFCKSSVSKKVAIHIRESCPIKFELFLDSGSLILYMQPLE
jgi:hypothetical protein